MPDKEFTITRLLDAPREVVFRAWTEPEQLAAWLGPHRCSTPRATVTVDARPGGRWRAVMVAADNGDRFPTGGVFREVDPPRRLVFTMGIAFGDEEVTEDSVVTIELAERGDKTEMTFHQAGFATVADKEGVRDGWSQALEKLAGYVSTLE